MRFLNFKKFGFREEIRLRFKENFGKIVLKNLNFRKLQILGPLMLSLILELLSAARAQTN